jgi:hypothetical protein
MRPASFAGVALLTFAGCTEPDTTVWPADVQWMEWPAEVQAATPFKVRMVVARPCARNPGFSPGTALDPGVVTFLPYFIVARRDSDVVCALTQPVEVTRTLLIPLDTTTGLRGLDPAGPYEMRAAIQLPLYGPASDRPVQPFGQIVVRAGTPDSVRTSGAGFVSAFRDAGGCLRLNQPVRGNRYVVENAPDSTSSWAAFVMGYLYAPATAVCGEARVFHLTSRLIF